MSAPSEKVLGRFRADMRKQLSANRHKIGWDVIDASMCYRRCLDEMGELHEAIASKATAETVRREAADVANWLLFLVENYDPPRESKP